MSEKRIDILREIVIVLVLGLVLVSSLSVKTVNAQAGQVTLNPTDDTYVDSSNPNSNYGGTSYLQIMNYQSTYVTDITIVWLKFNLSSVPDEAVIDGATLSLFTNYVGETFNVHAYSCTSNSWTEPTLTYTNMPSYNTTSMDAVLVATSNLYYNWSVVDAVRNALNGNPKSVTIVMQEPTHHSSMQFAWFDSKEYLAPLSSPTLTVHWSSIVPEFPSFLLLPLFMMATLLAVIIYKKKQENSAR